MSLNAFDSLCDKSVGDGGIWGEGDDDETAYGDCVQTQSEVFFVPVTDYIQMSAALALALILLLPEIQDKTKSGLTGNTLYMIAIVASAALASIPPQWAIVMGKTWSWFPCIGAIGMWVVTITYPVGTLLVYKRKKAEIIKGYADAIGMQSTSRAPFIQDKDEKGKVAGLWDEKQHIFDLCPAQPKRDNQVLFEKMQRNAAENQAGNGRCLWAVPDAGLNKRKLLRQASMPMSARRITASGTGGLGMDVKQGDRLVIGLDSEEGYGQLR